MPEQETRPVNRYLPPRPKQNSATQSAPRMLKHDENDTNGAGLLARWVDKILSN